MVIITFFYSQFKLTDGFNLRPCYMFVCVLVYAQGVGILLQISAGFIVPPVDGNFMSVFMSKSVFPNT